MRRQSDVYNVAVQQVVMGQQNNQLCVTNPNGMKLHPAYSQDEVRCHSDTDA